MDTSAVHGMRPSLTGAPMAAWERLLTAWLAATLLVFPLIRTTDLFGTETQADASFAAGSSLLQVVFGTLFALAAMLVWRRGHTALRLLPSLNPFLLLLLAWCACTVIWSAYPVVSIKRVVQFAGLVLTGVALCLPGDFATRLRRAALAGLTALLVVSFLVVLIMPSIGVDNVRGAAWRGIFWHKNTMGAGASICLLLWVDALCRRIVSPRTASMALAFVCLMLVMAKSSTALLTAALGVGVYLMAFARHRVAARHGLTLLWLAAGVLALIGVQIFFTWHGRLPMLSELTAPIAALVGKDSDLTGRTDLWQLVMLEVSRHPWQGLGYGAFWLNQGSPSQYIIDAVGWVPLQAHNGYVDILNELGLIGLGLFVLFIVWHIGQLVRLSHRNPGEASLHWSLLAIILVSNISESQLFNGIQFQNSLFILSSVLVSVSLRHTNGAKP